MPPPKISRPVSKARTNSNRSGDVAEAIPDKPSEWDRQLIRACEAANKDPDVFAIEKELDALSDEIAEPWIRAD
jgi:hypothetical protein